MLAQSKHISCFSLLLPQFQIFSVQEIPEFEEVYLFIYPQQKSLPRFAHFHLEFV